MYYLFYREQYQQRCLKKIKKKNLKKKKLHKTWGKWYTKEKILIRQKETKHLWLSIILQNGLLRGLGWKWEQRKE